MDPSNFKVDKAGERLTVEERRLGKETGDFKDVRKRIFIDTIKVLSEDKSMTFSTAQLTNLWEIAQSDTFEKLVEAEKDSNKALSSTYNAEIRNSIQKTIEVSSNKDFLEDIEDLMYCNRYLKKWSTKLRKQILQIDKISIVLNQVYLKQKLYSLLKNNLIFPWQVLN